MTKLEQFGILENRGKNFEEAIYLLALVYNICNTRISSFLKDYDLTPGKLNILLVVKHQGGQKGISQVDISKHLIVTPSNMTKLIDKLETEALVTRSALEGDRRVNIIRITKRGAGLLDSMWKPYNAMLKSLMENVTGPDQAVIAGKLKVWLKSLI